MSKNLKNLFLNDSDKFRNSNKSKKNKSFKKDKTFDEYPIYHPSGRNDTI